MNFNVGAVVTGVHYTDGVFQSIWYETITGGFGGILYMASGKDADWVADYGKRVKLIRAVEFEVSTVFLELTACDHIAFRNRQFPASNVVVMDIVEVFRSLNGARREAIAKKLCDMFKEKGNEAMKAYADVTPSMIDLEITKFGNYFADWQRKPGARPT
jgi:predicted sugar kinase